METLLSPPVGSILGLSSSCGCGSNVGLAAATLADALFKAAQEISQAAQAFSVATNNSHAGVNPDITGPLSVSVSIDSTSDGGEADRGRTGSGSTENHTKHRPVSSGLASLGNYSPTPVQSPSGHVDKLPRPEHADAAESSPLRESNNKREIMPPSPSIAELVPEAGGGHPGNYTLDTSQPINGSDQVHVGGDTNTLARPYSPVQPARETATEVSAPLKPRSTLSRMSLQGSCDTSRVTVSTPDPESLDSATQRLHGGSISVTSVNNISRNGPRFTVSVDSPSSSRLMPPGHYYIILDDSSNAVALISDLARQSKLTICGLPPEQNFERVQNILAHVSHLPVTRLGGMQSRSAPPQFGRQVSGILLCPNRACHTSLKTLGGDCLICWGVPPNVRQYEHECIAQMTHTYMLLTRAQYDRLVDEQLALACSLSQHPWSWRFKDSLENPVYPTSGVEQGITSNASQVSTIPQHVAPKPSVSLSCPLPAGHYHIILDEPLDAVPLLSYLALRSQRTICYLPVGKLGEPYRIMFNHITGIPTTYCDGAEVNKIKPAMRIFEKNPSAILLRPADDGWDICFSKSLADCVVYWGVPTRMDQFRADCLLKTARSYLVITRSQYNELLPRIPKSDRSFRHPSINRFNDEEQDSVLHDLRLKTAAILAGMSNPPISKDAYKAMLNRRGIAGQMSV